MKRANDSARHLLLGIGAMVFVAANPAVTDAQSAQGLLNKMLAAESKRAKGVDNYAMDIAVMGHESTLYYERTSMRGPNGKPMEMFRLVSLPEMQSRQKAGQGMSPEAWAAYSEAMRESGSAVSGEMDKAMNEAGLPPGMRDAMGSGAEAEPWASPNPIVFTLTVADLEALAVIRAPEPRAAARMARAVVAVEDVFTFFGAEANARVADRQSLRLTVVLDLDFEGNVVVGSDDRARRRERRLALRHQDAHRRWLRLPLPGRRRCSPTRRPMYPD